ncbi:MAG: hypothetical protein RL104_940, partial [Bacteroidota bacterium]
ADQPTYVGNNHFEFGAYAAADRHARTPGPYVLVNDTLLDRHAHRLWARWLRRRTLRTPGVHCDVYAAPRERPAEIPDPYASSWIFYLPTRADLETFTAAVRETLAQPTDQPSPAYEAFLHRWLNHPLPGVGYQGPRTPEDLARKRQTILWEHSLSRNLTATNQLREFKGLNYRVLRRIDQVLRRLQKSRVRLYPDLPKIPRA